MGMAFAVQAVQMLCGIWTAAGRAVAGVVHVSALSSHAHMWAQMRAGRAACVSASSPLYMYLMDSQDKEGKPVNTWLVAVQMIEKASGQVDSPEMKGKTFSAGLPARSAAKLVY